MRPVFTDDEGHLFCVLADGRAFYGRRVCKVPDGYMPAIPEDSLQFHDRLERMWSMVAKHLPLAHRQAMKMGVDGEAKDELVQEVGIYALLRAAWTDQGKSSFATYATRVLRNAYIDHFRKAKMDLVPLGEMDFEAPNGKERNDDISVWSYVRQMDRYDRTLLVARFVRGMPYTELAAVMGCGATLAHRHVQRAVGRLRDRIEQNSS